MLFKSNPIVILPLLATTLISLLGGCSSQTAAPSGNKPAAFWPPYPDEPRIQYLTSFHTSLDIQKEQSAFDKIIAGDDGPRGVALTKPYGVAMWQGKIYVCDLSLAAVTILDLRNHRTLMMGKTGSDQLVRPTAIAIAPDGMKYVADMGAGAVSVYDAQDRHIKTFSHKDFKPVGVAVWQDELFVPDQEARHVEVYNRFSGQLLRTFGEPGKEQGQFASPLGISVDKEGNAYVSDAIKCTIQKFDREGKLVYCFGSVSTRAGGIVRPKHIAVDSNGVIYVVDSMFMNVQLFNQDGQVLTFFGTPGKHPGAMILPVGISVDEGDMDLFADKIHPAFQPERLILVTNQLGDNKVSVYAMGHLKPGMTVNDISSSKGLVPEGTDNGSKNKLLLPSSALNDSTQAKEENATGANDAGKTATPATAPAR